MVKLDPSAGRSTQEQDAWELWLIEHPPPLSKYERDDACAEIDARRAEEMMRDAIPEPRLSGEPTRPDPTAGFLNHRTIGG